MQQCGACYKWMDGWLVSLGRGRYSLNYPMSYPIDHRANNDRLMIGMFASVSLYCICPECRL